MTTMSTSLPRIIQGGMGVGVSDWKLARAVSLEGCLGVVSGTGLATLLARRLQTGDPDGHMREGLSAFPLRELAERILKRYFIPGGKAADAPFRATPLPNLNQRFFNELTLAANFVEVHLAKCGHCGPIGLNLLEKIQMPTLPSLLGAMMAKVDYVLMGAGIPRAIPGVLDLFAAGERATLKLDAQGTLPEDDFQTELDPADYGIEPGTTYPRPRFISVISSAVLAKTMATRASGQVFGFVVEGPSAGGHNAPPRGPLQLDENGEPLFSERDNVDLGTIRALGLPFWLAGSYGRPGKLEEALTLGATGIQVGTAFAFCEESGLHPSIKQLAIRQSRAGTTKVFTDPYASPTGFPIKVLEVEGTLSEASVYEERRRVCDLGYLRTPYRKDDGTLGYRCPGEPVEDYLRKGGTEEATHGRKCLCNGLFGSLDLGQTHSWGRELPFITAGSDASRVAEFLPPGQDTYTVRDIIQKLEAPCPV